jgi:ATP-dependent Zn protease
MRKSFADAKAVAPAILFIDEIDSFPDRGKIAHSYADYEIQIVNALLTEIDGVDGRDGVILIAACNHPEKLDPALVRSGRLDRHIAIRYPNRSALARILREHLAEDLVGEDLSAAAMAASGSSGADCERLVRGARRRARSEKRVLVLDDLINEIGGTDVRSPDDQWIAAVHEAGHAVATCVLWPGALGVVSLQGSAEVGGRVSVNDAASVYIRRGDLRERLVVLLAGRAAEEMIFGMPSSGAGGREASDLAQTTYLAVIALAALGLDEIGGLVWRGLPDISAVPALLANHPVLAKRVHVVLDDAHAAARDLLRPRIPAVTGLAQVLLTRRVLDGAEAEAIVRRHLDADDKP